MTHEERRNKLDGPRQTGAGKECVARRRGILPKE